MIKKYLTISILALALVACNKPAGELVGVSSSFMNQGFRENNPYGMVFIKRGSFMMGTNDQSAFGNTNDKPVNVTVDAFWMDGTEITNDEYKQFVYWVRDSIARRLLAMQDDDDLALRYLSSKFKDSTLTPEMKKYGALNWRVNVPWSSKDQEVQNVLNQLYYDNLNELSSKKSVNPANLPMNTDGLIMIRLRYHKINMM